MHIYIYEYFLKQPPLTRDKIAGSVTKIVETVLEELMSRPAHVSYCERAHKHVVSLKICEH